MTRRKRTRGHKPKANKLCVSYARVSSKEQYQSGYSLAAQTDLIEAYADENGLKLVERYSDVHSAKAPGRPSFSDMVEFLIRQQYKPSPCRIILVEKTDRLYRNLIDAANLMELDLDIHLIRDNTVISRNDGPSESLVHGLHILISKFHNDNLAADTKKGMYKKVRQGGWPHIGPLGYRNTLGSDGKGAIVPDESRAQHIRELFQMYATGRWTLSSVRNQLVLDGLTTRRGNKPTKSLIHQILTNPIYYGEMFWNGKLWPGKHEPLIEKALFERVQDRLEGKRSSGTGPRKTRWAYQGLVKCGHCGCSMVAEAHKGHTYYHCSGARGRCPEVRWAKEPEIRNAFQEALSLIALDHVHLNWAVQSLRETHKERFSYLKKRGESLEREQERLEQKRKIAYNDRLSGVISQEDYVAIRSEFQTRQSEIQGRLADLRSSGRVYVDDGVRVLELAQKASQLYEKQSPLEGRRLLNILFSNSIWMDQKLQPNFRKPFDVLALLGHEAKKRKGALPKKSALSAKWLPIAGLERTGLVLDSFKMKVRPIPLSGRQKRRERKAARDQRIAKGPSPAALALEKAIRWQEAIDTEGINRADVARREGLTRARVTQIMGLLNLPEDIKVNLRDNASHTRGWSIRQALGKVADYKEPMSPTS